MRFHSHISYLFILAFAVACDGDPKQTGPVCGDGVIQGDEACDGSDLRGATCVSEGYTGGTLACAVATCTYDHTACENVICGNALIEGDEACDGFELGDQTCEGLGFRAGALACAADCTHDTAGCVPVDCGNGILDEQETCDGTDLGEVATCRDLNAGDGMLTCGETCALDTTGCRRCTSEADIDSCVGCLRDVYPTGFGQYMDVFNCAICVACYTVCDGVAYGCGSVPGQVDPCDAPMYDRNLCEQCVQCAIAGSGTCGAAWTACQADNECAAAAVGVSDCPPGQ